MATIRDFRSARLAEKVSTNTAPNYLTGETKGLWAGGTYCWAFIGLINPFSPFRPCVYADGE